MDKAFFTKYFMQDFCTIDTPFEEIGFLNCHRKFKDIDMFDILCQLQKEYQKQQKTINYLERRLKKYEPLEVDPKWMNISTKE
jgi:hypothetical protein